MIMEAWKFDAEFKKAGWVNVGFYAVYYTGEKVVCHKSKWIEIMLFR